MKFLLLGTWKPNTGPCNVNRSLIEHSDGSMRYLTWTRFGRIERWLKCIFSNPIVVSGGLSRTELNIIRLLKKKVVYILHGYRKYENVLNKLNLSEEELWCEAEGLKIANLILPVSEIYSHWVKERLPQFNNKISFLNNGVCIDKRPLTSKIPFSIAVSGGNRTIKNCSIVCEAVAKLINKGYDCKVHVFGRFYEGGDDLSCYPFVIKMGHLSKEQYYNELDKISLFVVNSELEPFGLVVADAINCNCALLMSHNVGASSIMSVRDSDIVYDTHNVEEVSSKILDLLLKSNHNRLYSSIDINDVSEKSAFQKLKKIVHEI